MSVYIPRYKEKPVESNHFSFYSDDMNLYQNSTTKTHAKMKIENYAEKYEIFLMWNNVKMRSFIDLAP